MRAWRNNEQALKNWLIKTTGDNDQAEDILQDIFLKALKDKERFCTLSHAKSWLFKIARNTVIDTHRKPKLETSSSLDDILNYPLSKENSPLILELQTCLFRVMSELDDQDRDIIESCDINGMSQVDYAEDKGLALPAVKSRIQRARQKLRSGMVTRSHFWLTGSPIPCSA
ncbi:sigma-70 family RNA polymerase sigma factor [Sansalvadorimonas sp. 2012CJ34-2]|uniref:Sigma-70 family RNA polymerase sigma factor n=1 Tax=Parendozoicomonas callyspongiae TaxID=2942213 RepID=A0ABT0PE79_9GAMM|nr:sigma-70 family RNA polymerase sigma factor [Sansalvadorimonas sp. 2012CJ34-2]MCL6269670.1 sigma-70 family RNA polymerase sigma factor [Sansalvadorimonas sp. 2012CJ34-2]